MTDVRSARQDPVLVAARNNAEWCAIVCTLHGIAGTFDREAWASAVRTPDLYPDAVTLARSADAARLVARVDASSGCSIKDSCADLDLAPWGFEPLFQATWIHHPAAPPRRASGPLRWEPVRDSATLRSWETAWGAGIDRPRVFLPALLERDDATVLAAFSEGEIVAGAILNRAAGVLGLSNLFASGVDLAETFAGAIATSARLAPGVAIVGYELGIPLEAAEQTGFERVGELVVWHRA